MVFSLSDTVLRGWSELMGPSLKLSLNKTSLSLSLTESPLIELFDIDQLIYYK